MANQMERQVQLCPDSPDFGLSSELKRATRYVPPEYATSGKRGAPGDVFALGVRMLFVLGRQSWRIADVHNRGTARDAMLNWVKSYNISPFNGLRKAKP